MRGNKLVLSCVAGLVGLVSLASCTPEEPEDFGTVRIEVSPANGDLMILAGTTEVVATVEYGACLTDFYLNRQPTYTKDGPDGAPVFTDFEARLCSDYDDIPECEITDISQTLISSNDVYRLSVTYKITNNDPASIAYREFHVGPIPVEEFAGCGEGEGALVELATSGLLGKNAQGDTIWRISTLPAQNSARANQGAPLRVTVVAENDMP